MAERSNVSVRWLRFDQFEFDVPDSEESLVLAISDIRQHKSVEAFLFDVFPLATATLPNASPVALSSIWRSERIASYIERFGGVSVPDLDACQTWEINDDPDDWTDLELVLTIGAVHVYYHWKTTA